MTSSSPAARSITNYRSDIEGVRAIAIALVLLFHAGVPFVGGGYVGVDVFFVLSGFLITGVMLRDIEATGGLSLARFWARRARRLLPAAFVALAGASVVAWLWLPLTQREVFGKDIFAASVYLVNWRLAARSVDYLAESVVASPVQHFWSLAVEEQFYIIWPLVIVAVLLVARRVHVSSRTALSVVIGVAVVASLWWSVVQTSQDPTVAYFSTFTRFWEIGLGAVVALSVGTLARLPDRALAVLGWLGLFGVGLSAVWFSSSTPFPSYTALFPIGSAALILISGLRQVAGSPYRILSIGPAVWLGGLSYSVYLWHWIALVAATAWWGELTVPLALAVTAASFVPAVLVHYFIENPIRFGTAMKRPRNALAAGAGFMVASALCGVLVVASVGSVEYAVVIPDPELPPGPVVLTPDPFQAADDVPDAYAGGCQVNESSTEVVTCVYGSDELGKTVMLIGDSKAVQWEPALQLIAERSGWQLRTMAKAVCAFSEVDQILKGERFTTCSDWNDDVMAEVARVDPDIVVVSGLTRKGIPKSAPDTQEPTVAVMVGGYSERWHQLEDMGIQVVVIADNPNPTDELDVDVYECVAQNPEDYDACSFDTERGVAISGAPDQRAAAAFVDVDIIDLTDVICSDICPAVTNNILVYRQTSHLTRTYVEWLAPLLGTRLLQVTGSEFGW